MGTSGTGRGTLCEVDGTLRELWDELGEPRRGPRWVGEPSEMSRTGWGTLGEVRDGSVDPRGGPGRVGKPMRRSGTGRGTLEEVWAGS